MKRQHKPQPPRSPRLFTEPDRSAEHAQGAYTAQIDGASRGNPGPASYAVLIRRPNGEVLDQLKKEIGRGTNNVAEYYALIAALDYAQTHRISKLRVRSDSELLVRRLKGTTGGRASRCASSTSALAGWRPRSPTSPSSTSRGSRTAKRTGWPMKRSIGPLRRARCLSRNPKLENRNSKLSPQKNASERVGATARSIPPSRSILPKARTSKSQSTSLIASDAIGVPCTDVWPDAPTSLRRIESLRDSSTRCVRRGEPTDLDVERERYFKA